jgi:hypothetical protein
VAYLIDTALDKLIDLKRSRTYEFYLGEHETVRTDEDARFILLVGSEGFVADQDLPDLPARTALHQVYPNPSMGSTMLRFDISRDADVSIKIYSAAGRLVREVFAGRCKPGRYEAVWDGRNQAGSEVSSGVYFCRMEGSGFSQAKRLVLLR